MEQRLISVIFVAANYKHKQNLNLKITMNDEKLAVLIDADNIPYAYIKEMLEEIDKIGTPTIKRIYADWTKPTLSGWKNVLLENAITPIQQYSYTSGKNSSDSALIIDAMDILYSGKVDGFCIVSSDSDYTGLAKRIREDGFFVMGIGEQKTPNAFVKSCEIFTYVENLEPRTEKPEKKEAVKKQHEKIHVNIRLINKAYDMSINESNEAYISTLGINLRKLDPSFDVRTYGCKTLTQLFTRLPDFVVVDNLVNGLNNPLVKKK